jgi:diadenosine tetraphosphate (Ap4A) HIT family hydrolase
MRGIVNLKLPAVNRQFAEWSKMGIETCFICRKHQGLEAAPPGGYIHEDEHWMVCHAPGKLGPPGTLFLESRRHFLDYSEMLPGEAESLGELLRRVFAALKGLTHAERVYQLSTMEGQPHLHMWLVPRRKEDQERGLKFLAREDSCTEQEAEALARELREWMQQDDRHT